MPILPNKRYEAFAQELAKGLPAVRAFVAAGYAENHSNASRLSRNELIVSRVQELQSLAAEKAGVTVQWVLDKLIDNAARAAENDERAVVNKSLELIGKHLGMFKEDKTVNVSLTLEALVMASYQVKDD